jgi:hypothetical protein
MSQLNNLSGTLNVENYIPMNEKIIALTYQNNGDGKFPIIKNKKLIQIII